MNTLQLVDKVVALRAERGLVLVTAEANPGVVHMDLDPGELLTELLRLARLGAVTELAVYTIHDRATPKELMARAGYPQPFGPPRT